MNSPSRPPEEVRDRQWFIIRRWQTYAGEMRALVLRAIAVVVLYACQLGHHFLVLSAEGRAANERFQQGATMVSVLLLIVSLLTLLLILKRVLPGWLPFVTTGIDLLAIASLIALAGGPMATSLTGAFYLVIAMAGLRFDLKLVWGATLGAMLAYMASVGVVDDSWFDADHAVPLVQQGVSLVCLAATGLIVGQVIRLARQLAEQYHQRMDVQAGKES